MSRFPIHLRLVIVPLMLLCAAGTIGCSMIESPSDVVERAGTALEKRDWPTYVSCFTPETHEAAARQSIQNSLMVEMGRDLATLGGPVVSKEVDAKAKPLYDLLAKHGISKERLSELAKMPNGAPKEQAISETVAAIPDKEAFMADMIAYGDQARSQGAPPPMNVAGEIKSVEVQGDRATVTTTATVNGRSFDTQVNLRRTAKGWKIDMAPMFGG